MKKTYIIPETEVTETQHKQNLLTGSVDARQTEGGPTGDGVPKGIGDTETTPDPFGGKGQDGDTNRSNDWGLWDDNGSSYNLW